MRSSSERKPLGGTFCRYHQRSHGLVLVGIGTAFLLLGDRQEAIMLFLATIPLLFMDAFLHWRTQASTASLKGQLAADVLIIREGQRLRVDSHDIVPGDLVVLNSEDHFLPADGYWENVNSIQVDESVLTGRLSQSRRGNFRSMRFRSRAMFLSVPDSLGLPERASLPEMVCCVCCTLARKPLTGDRAIRIRHQPRTDRSTVHCKVNQSTHLRSWVVLSAPRVHSVLPRAWVVGCAFERATLAVAAIRGVSRRFRFF